MSNENQTPIETKVPKQPTNLSPELQKLLDQKNDLMKKIAEAKKAEQTAKRQKREDEKVMAFVMLRYILRHTSDNHVKDLVNEVIKELKPNENYSPEQVEKDKESLKRMIGAK